MRWVEGDRFNNIGGARISVAPVGGGWIRSVAM
jgi:hypothetical protein